MSNKRIFHFTLGPVQGFVSQARRTRDLWAGSFLLAYLSGHAMKAVTDKGGKIDFPSVHGKDPKKPTDELLKAINQRGKGNINPQIGSLPNRFKASVPKGFKPEVCQDAVQKAWKQIADAVWKKYLNQYEGEPTHKIWQRQVDNFWDMSWVIGEDPQDKSDGAWLDKRKNWRTYQPPIEEGDHCTLMGDWQELSGIVRVKDREKQDNFWSKLKESAHISDLELPPSERLCAIAFIKRFFPKVAKNAIGWDPQTKNWPSTSYMAAVSWLLDIALGNSKEAREQCSTYADKVIEISGKLEGRVMGESQTELLKPENVQNDLRKKLEQMGSIVNLDGSFFFKESLENPNILKFKEDTNDTENLKEQLIKALEELQKVVGNKASPFYALLLMDGDSLGGLLQRSDIDQAKVSEALDEFTKGVQGIVSSHFGMTVYAGGDDVLALLPLSKVLEAAVELRSHYLESFRNVFEEDITATISAGVVFANNRLTLRSVIKQAHHLLDDIAKDENGRDSIAIAVATGSGNTVEWVSTWQDPNDTSGKTLPEGLNELAEKFTQNKLTEKFAGNYSNQFFFNIGERFSILLDEKQQLTNEALPLKLLTAEYLKSREHQVSYREAEEHVGNLLSVCRKRCNKSNMDEKERVKVEKDELKTLLVDGALLVRFLANRGAEQ